MKCVTILQTQLPNSLLTVLVIRCAIRVGDDGAIGEEAHGLELGIGNDGGPAATAAIRRFPHQEIIHSIMNQTTALKHCSARAHTNIYILIQTRPSSLVKIVHPAAIP